MKDNFKYLVKLGPWIGSENLGDSIIRGYCENILEELFPHSFTVEIPTRNKLINKNIYQLLKCDCAFVCGTNLLSSKMYKLKSWNISKNSLYRNLLLVEGKRKLLDNPLDSLNRYVQNQKKIKKIVLFGVSWGGTKKIANNVKDILNTVLSTEYLHSVRDEESANMLRLCGITNVINTGCPTMWNLTNNFCKTIPTTKADNVITTLTNYNRNPVRDLRMINILLENYLNVYVWIQAFEDYEYLTSLGVKEKVKIIPPTVKDFNLALSGENIEYVGTRLHAGIHALNRGKRTLILAVDNRALDIAKDTNLPAYSRNLSDTEIEKLIREGRICRISIKEANIQKWKSQFV